MSSPSSRTRWTAGALVAVVAGLAWASTREGASEAPPSHGVHDARADPLTDAPQAQPVLERRPDILLFTIDTVRADHLSTYGYDRATSPALTSLATRGTRFDRAYAASSWTAPSVASILTGVLPSQHGVLHAWIAADGAAMEDALSPESPSVVAALHDAGYRTVGVTANGCLVPEVGFARGFDDYECLGFADLDRVRPAVESRLAALTDGDTPYFLWVHLVDAHAPHRATGSAFGAFWPEDRERYPALDEVFFEENLVARMSEHRIPVALGTDYVAAAYDSEIRADDDYLAELLARLDDGHLAVVVASDHGEELREHGRIGHGHTLFEEVTRVPLVVLAPGQSASVVTTPVSLVDVLPTLVELGGGEAPVGIAGRSLVPALRGEPLTPRDVIAESGRAEIVHAIIDGDLKFGEMTEPLRIEVLYDLAVDPGEQHDMRSERAERADELAARLHAALDAAAAARPASSRSSPVPVSSVTIEQLRALGYIEDPRAP